MITNQHRMDDMPLQKKFQRWWRDQKNKINRQGLTGAVLQKGIFAIVCFILLIMCFTTFLNHNPQPQSSTTILNHNPEPQSLPVDGSLMSEEERIEYLLGPWSTQKFEAKDMDWKQFQKEREGDGYGWEYPNYLGTNLLRIDGHKLALQHRASEADEKGYFPHFVKMLERIDASNLAPHCKANAQNQALQRHGEQWDSAVTFPFFAKTRGLDGGGIVQQCFNQFRHWQRWGPCSDAFEGKDIEWEHKMDRAFWRGASTGGVNSNQQKRRSFHSNDDLPLRVSFVEQYFESDPQRDSIDVAFDEDKMVLGWGAKDLGFSKMTKPALLQEELLKHKYLVSIEGNDVASNTKWMMASNSVVFMPKPTVESWMMEGTLRAGVHYVELKYDEQTGWNLEEQIQFCIDNDAKCKEIAENGKRFMEHYRFCDEEYQQEVEAKVIDRYCQQVNLQLTYE